MKKIHLFFALFFCALFIQAQYNFPACSPEWDAAKKPYKQGQKASYEGNNYRCKYWSNDTPKSASWELISACGDGGLGAPYNGKQRIIGYLPTWVADYDIKNNFNPEVVTNLNISFLMFKKNNDDYNSNDFASISFDKFQERKVDSVLNDLGVLQKAKAKNVKVSVALGGATDYAFLWLMTKYANNDQKLDEIATLIANYVTVNNLDGIDLDLECWWADPTIKGTKDQGGRVRGSKWGDADKGAHPAGVGLKKLSQKLRAKMPNKLITAAVFGTSWYGNNYDDGIADYMDWVALMSYDFTGSWGDSPVGPHSSLYKVPAGTYPKQTADNPIYSAEDALEYWMGIAPSTWNHAGGFNVPKAKLVFGVPMYGYDFSEKKPNGGNGSKFVPYKDIIAEFPNAATSYDPKDTSGLNGFVGTNGKNIYFDTPKSAAKKIVHSKNHGHQGIIIWELTQDVDYNSSSSILKAINEAAGNNNTVNNPPTITWQAPANNQVIEVAKLAAITLNATATDKEGTVQTFIFKHNNTVINATASGSSYTASFTPTAFGQYTITAVATDDKNATSEKSIVFTVKEKGVITNEAPKVSITSPSNNATFSTGESIVIKANASDSDGTVSKVEFFNNGKKLGESTTTPYNYTITNSIVGNYSLTAIATDNEGATTTSSIVTAVVSDIVNAAPKVTITSPSNNTSFNEGDAISITANASDSDGSVTKVEFYNNGTKLGESIATPYSYAISNSTVGDYSLTAIATDNSGATTTSAAVSITVSKVIGGNCGNLPQYVAGTSYALNQEVVNGAEIFNCDVPGWCSSPGAWAYAPGTGTYWEMAWSKAGTCSNVSPKNPHQLSLFPSVTKNVVNLDIKAKNSSSIKIELYNLAGLLVKTQSYNKEKIETIDLFTQDLSKFENGLYLFKIYIDDAVYFKKVFKK
ncbi:Ig-like domain-containing protein [Tenacibaculum ovolyticum]|uniref:Ig-like domain-containing protein n=1 Tax=Tenacibaculum ovolyticum TaxID=104270 RepID=UPI0004023673|nr:Ig-like domain-containing protein [Tenacibaculum ovolyticum]